MRRIGTWGHIFCDNVGQQRSNGRQTQVRMKQNQNITREGAGGNSTDACLPRQPHFQMTFQRWRAVQPAHFVPGATFNSRVEGMDGHCGAHSFRTLWEK
jgi:hypothetical protein